ncbi:hypothetical protein HPB52_014302 [Rhipicephalus sanguineus]|uniref:Caspase family p20 domain-containing protein n=1 Tax=Rhipicephalus sanguineus TaxID=34632 RepID=A0A9D4PJK8_RHISA|nr:hypothetical protein HPB52_014302 [Rhipicephalus sanguineus]
MSRLPRGMCVIINNCNFEDVTERCDGSVHDVRPMEALFKTFLFDCIVHTDLKADEMKKLLSEAANSKEHEQAQCLVVVLISHGNQDTILGKPKLFFIQACQKNESDSGGSTTVAETADTMAKPAEEPQFGKRIPSWSDMRNTYAVIPGYDALRDIEIALWFLSAIYTVFSQYAFIVHLDDLMQQVHEEVLRKSSHCGYSHTLSVDKRKHDSEASTTVADTADAMADTAGKRVSSWSDMYIAYAVISQYDAPRDTDTAPCFLSVVFTVLSQWRQATSPDVRRSSPVESLRVDIVAGGSVYHRK